MLYLDNAPVEGQEGIAERPAVPQALHHDIEKAIVLSRLILQPQACRGVFCGSGGGFWDPILERNGSFWHERALWKPCCLQAGLRSKEATEGQRQCSLPLHGRVLCKHMFSAAERPSNEALLARE